MIEETDFQENTGPRRTMHPERLMKFRYVYPLFFAAAPILLYFDRFKWSALILVFGFMVIGFQFRWKLQHMGSLHPLMYVLTFLYTWALASYGVWYDFLTGSVFLFLGFVTVLGYTAGIKWGGISVILALINLGLCALMFFFHLKYSQILVF
jgi:hypothetical protein